MGMDIKGVTARGKRAWEERRGAVGVVRTVLEELPELSVNESRRELEQYWEFRRGEIAREQELRERAIKLPETIEKFGGRVALVTNFGAAPGETGPRQIGLNIADALLERGFGDADELVVNSLYSMRKMYRMHEFTISRQYVKAAFLDRLSDAVISSNDDFHEGNYSLPVGQLQESLERTADFYADKKPGSTVGYVCIVSALELAPLGLDVRHNGWEAYGEDYHKIKYGGALMLNNGTWEAVVSGNQFKTLPEAVQAQSRQEEAERWQ
jgi:hypothetical protein